MLASVQLVYFPCSDNRFDISSPSGRNTSTFRRGLQAKKKLFKDLYLHQAFAEAFTEDLDDWNWTLMIILKWFSLVFAFFSAGVIFHLFCSVKTDVNADWRMYKCATQAKQCKFAEQINCAKFQTGKNFSHIVFFGKWIPYDALQLFALGEKKAPDRRLGVKRQAKKSGGLHRLHILVSSMLSRM